MDNDIAVHVRNATFGDKNLDNCHPYRILDKDDGDKMDLYMMHNGTIRDVQVDKKMSDSWNFATKFLKGYFRKHPNALQEKEFHTLLAAIIGASKLIFLDSRGNYTIINEDLGTYHPTGVWISTKNEVKVPVYVSTIPVTPTKDSFGAMNGGRGFGKPAKTTIFPMVGNWKFKIGGWDEDSDGRIHYNPNLAQPAADESKIDVITAELPEMAGIDSGTAKIDEEGIYALLPSIPGQSMDDVRSFVLEYRHESVYIIEKLGGKTRHEARTVVSQQPWEAAEAIKTLAVEYVTNKENVLSQSN
jgi:hypothetical protein